MTTIQLGSITCIHGDCMDYMRDLPDNAFDLAIVDPPYGVGMDGGNVGYKGNNNLTKKDWDKGIPPQSYFDRLFEISKNQIIWGCNYFPLPPSRCFIVWDKGEGFKGRTYAECEMAYTSFDENAKIYKRDPLAKRDYVGKIHPTQKPIALYKYLLQNYAKTGDRIFDSHGGSFSHAIACHDLGFELTIIEKDKDYFDAAVKRLEEHQTKQKEIRELGYAKTELEKINPILF